MTTPAKLALLCCLPLTALAATAVDTASDTPTDYSHAISLQLSGKNALVQVRLPPAAYLHSRSHDLNDLRVFDGAGRALPFALLEPKPAAQASTRALPAAIFPVHTDGSTARRDDVEIRTSSGGTITSITTRKDGAAQQELSALVLDFGAGAPAQPINALVFTPPPGVGNYEAQVTLEVSDDLRSWDTLAYASLSWLSNSAQQTLANNRMAFAPRAFRYGRLVWRHGKPIGFAAISAQAQVAQAPTAPTDSITLQPQAGRFANDLVYQAGVAIPAERIGLTFGSGNVVMPAQLGHYVALPASRGTSNTVGTRWEFQPHLQATFYQFVQDGAERRSADIAAAGMRAAQWVVRPSVALASKPTMTLSWRPATLVFMASGSAPYSLQVGRAGVATAQRAIGEVAPGLSEAELSALERATAGAVRANRPAASLGHDGDMGALRRKLVLWAVLLLGVAVLGAMAWKLSRQMKESG